MIFVETVDFTGVEPHCGTAYGTMQTHAEPCGTIHCTDPYAEPHPTLPGKFNSPENCTELHTELYTELYMELYGIVQNCRAELRTELYDCTENIA